MVAASPLPTQASMSEVSHHNVYYRSLLIVLLFLKGSENNDEDDDIFADLDRRTNIVATTEPTTYINADPDHSGVCSDPIRFWSDNDRDRFARMALDFVSAPGKCVLTCKSE